MKLTSFAGIAALVAVLMTGCSMSSGQDAGVPEMSTDSRGGAPAPGVAEDALADPQSGNRDVITTGHVSLTVEDPLRSAEQAAQVTERAGGRVDSRTENPATPHQPASATLSLRIPAERLDASLTELKKLGTVNFVSLNASDVTQQTQDVDARIASLTTSVDRLLALMASADNTADLIAIETALSERQAELESLRSQRDYLSDQIDFSTINLELFATGTIAPGAPVDFWSGIVAGWNALVATLGGLVVGIGVALPWLAALGAFALIVVLVVRLAMRKRPARPGTGAVPPETGSAQSGTDASPSGTGAAPPGTGAAPPRTGAAPSGGDAPRPGTHE